SLADLSTRSGLRKTHSQIDRIYTELDAFYQLGKARNSPQLLAGVVSILVKMCTDSILKEKLFEKGFLDMIVDLLEHDLTRYMALKILLAFAHDGSRKQGDVLTKIAGHSRTLARLIHNRPNEHNVVELAVVVMAHAVRFFTSTLTPAASHRLQEIGLHDLLQSMFAVLRRRNPSKSLLTHALMLLITPAQYLPAFCKDDTSMIEFFVALLRAKDISTRVAALEGILNISEVHSEPDTYEVDLQHLTRIMKDAESSAAATTGSDSLDLYRLSNRYIEVMSRAARDRDWSALGRHIADIVQRSPSVVEGSWSQLEEDVDAPALASHRSRATFSVWSDALPECARTLRQSGRSSDLDAADILDMKYMMLRGRIEEAITMARTASSRSPDHVYARYVISLCGDTAEGLRAAEEGLKCPGVTPFLRKQMLWRAVEFGVYRGFEKILSTSETEDNQAQEGIVSLRQALENVNVFLAEAPSDAHLRLTMLGWKLLLVMTLRGPELSDSLIELTDIRQEIEAAITTKRTFGYTIHKTRIHNAWNQILQLNDASLREWGAIIHSCNQVEARTHCSGASVEHRGFALVTDQEPLPETYLGMQQCSWCGALSVSLKKCKGCGSARYCDIMCQRGHWTEHKQACRGGPVE
ncbi:hypothetical protein L227DRAFT_514423, partial [Lentinus tigrinus ALCF2SS1-6]